MAKNPAFSANKNVKIKVMSHATKTTSNTVALSALVMPSQPQKIKQSVSANSMLYKCGQAV
jgi:hypothetical protein